MIGVLCRRTETITVCQSSERRRQREREKRTARERSPDGLAWFASPESITVMNSRVRKTTEVDQKTPIK